jgi:hypothetical protein
VHRSGLQQEWREPSVAYMHVPDIEVKGTEVRIVL